MSQIHEARHWCKLNSSVYKDFVILGDSGYTLTMIGMPADPTGTEVLKVTGVSARDMVCVLKARRGAGQCRESNRCDPPWTVYRKHLGTNSRRPGRITRTMGCG